MKPEHQDQRREYQADYLAAAGLEALPNDVRSDQTGWQYHRLSGGRRTTIKGAVGFSIWKMETAVRDPGEESPLCNRRGSRSVAEPERSGIRQNIRCGIRHLIPEPGYAMGIDAGSRDDNF